MTAPASSWDLVTAAQSGDRDAFAQLYCRYAPIVAGFLARRVWDHALVEDLTSETFTRALRHIRLVQDQGKDVRAWLVTIARNLICDHAKSHRVRREIAAADVQTLVVDARVLTASGGVEQSVLARLDGAVLVRLVAGLPSDQGEVIRLRFWRGLSVAETAEALDRSEQSVRALQHRGMVRLRKAYGGEAA